jgi:hypothetical protein
MGEICYGRELWGYGDASLRSRRLQVSGSCPKNMLRFSGARSSDSPRGSANGRARMSAGSVRDLMRVTWAICLVLVLQGCRPQASVSVQLPFIPVTFTIDSDWHVSVSAGVSIATFLGTFSVQSGVTAALRPGFTRVLIVYPYGGTEQEQAYDIGETGLMTLCLNGQFQESVSSDSIEVDPLSAPSQVNLVPGKAACPVPVASVPTTPAPPTSAPTTSAPASVTSPGSPAATKEPSALAGSVSLPASAWKPVDGATVIQHPDGVFEVTYDPTYWGGVFAYTNVGCNYRFAGEGRVLDGGGYGLTVWASIDSSGTPHGQSIQYDMGMGGYRNVQLPDDSETGPVQYANVDNSWHTVSIQVFGGQYVESVDGSIAFSGEMPVSCTDGIFIRLWNSADVEFKNLTVTPIRSLS